jgi:hypothetical protein
MDRYPGSPHLRAGIEQEIADLYEKEAGGIHRYACALARNQERPMTRCKRHFYVSFCAVGGLDSVPEGLVIPRGAQLRVDQMKAAHGMKSA